MSRGTTNAILALFGKVEVLILLLMAINSSSAKITDPSLVGILSLSGVFLELKDFRMVLITFSVILEPQLE